MRTTKTTNRKRVVATALIALGVVGITAASASKLGVNSVKDVASGVSEPIPVCDDEVDAEYVVASDLNANGSFDIASVDVAGIDDKCDGKTVTVYTLDKTDGVLTTDEAAYDKAAGGTISIPVADTVTNFDVVKIAVVIK